MPTTRTLQIDTPSALRMGAFLVGGLLLAAAGVYFVHYGRLNHDEGWYLYAARLILDGQLPYRDFAFYQSPLLPIVYMPFRNTCARGSKPGGGHRLPPAR